MDDLVLSHLWIVKIYVFKYRRFFDEDLYQEGVIGLINASEKYDPSLGKFSSYASIRIRGAILDAIRKEMKHADKKVSFLMDIHDFQPSDENSELDEKDFDIDIESLLNNEKLRNRDIITRHLNGELLRVIAYDHGITESRCCQIYQRFIRKLKEQHKITINTMD